MGRANRCIYLPGDSFPADDRIRLTLQKYLGTSLDLIEREKPADIEARVRLLKAELDENPNGGVILFGRSSGCRVVTRLGADPRYTGRIGAIVALSYPFQRPGRGDEPERYLHLPNVEPRCLIVLGAHDDHSSAPDRYVLSPSTALLMVMADHSLRLSAHQWQQVSTDISQFLGLTPDGVMAAAE